MTARTPRGMALSLALPLAALGGCMNLSGLGGSSRYACGAPEGVSCQSVSTTYAHGPRAKEAPLEAKAGTSGLPSVAEAGDLKPSQRAPSAGSTVPLRTPPRVLRLWFKAWEDNDRDLVDQGYVYVQVDPGGWQLEDWQRQVRSPYRPIRAPRTPAAAVDKSDKSTESGSASPASMPPPAQSPAMPVPMPQRP